MHPLGGQLATLHAPAFHETLVEWLGLCPALVINRPTAMESKSSKPFQAQLIGAGGFRCPSTLVTNDPAAVLAFKEKHTRIIYKSISGIRSIVRELDDARIQRLARIRNLPTQFQEYIPGVDIRVHVVGPRTFAAEVKSDAIDYRYARQDGLEADLRAIELPEELVARCIDLSRSLQLPLCGIDLRRTPEGEYVCLEANPMPAYSYYESSAGLPISAALADLLATGVCDV